MKIGVIVRAYVAMMLMMLRQHSGKPVKSE
jgi:hypothetical protein